MVCLRTLRNIYKGLAKKVKKENWDKEGEKRENVIKCL